MARLYACDLHNHTCLSPCAQLEMHPRALVQALLAKGVAIAAITDHNASENIMHVMHAARGAPLTIIPGMEVTTREEAHVLALFKDLETIADFQELVYARLSEASRYAADPENQPIVNEHEEIEGFNQHQLFAATQLALEELTGHIHRRGGIAIASHIDRPYFSVLSQLAMVPAAAHFDALEISASLGISRGRHRYPELAAYPFITSSDSHCLDDVGRACTRMRLASPSFDEIRLALIREGGRYIVEAPS